MNVIIFYTLHTTSIINQAISQSIKELINIKASTVRQRAAKQKKKAEMLNGHQGRHGLRQQMPKYKKTHKYQSVQK